MSGDETTGATAVGSAIDPSTCPLCGGPNGCGAAEGRRSCWCYSTTIPAEVLARIPEPLRDQVCICARCAAGEGAPRPPIGLD